MHSPPAIEQRMDVALPMVGWCLPEVSDPRRLRAKFVARTIVCSCRGGDFLHENRPAAR